MKKNIFLTLSLVLLVSTFLFSYVSFSQEQITLTTYYPSPHGSFQEILLNPTTGAILNASCSAEQNGTIRFDGVNQTIVVCATTPGAGNFIWMAAPGYETRYWVRDANGIHAYDVQTGQYLNVGIRRNSSGTYELDVLGCVHASGPCP